MSRLRAALCAGLIAWHLQAAAQDRFVARLALPTGQTVVVAEGDDEARSIGSFSVRLYQAAPSADATTFFAAGMIRARDGTLDRVLLADVDGDRQPDIVVVVRSAGTGGYLSAHAFAATAERLSFIAAVQGLDARADPIAALRVAATGEAGTARPPSFACDKVRAGSIEALVCEDEDLSALDRRMAAVYAAASAKATNEHPPMLRAEQRGWIKGRDDCWKSDDRPACVRDAYRQRIAELQARYRLVEAVGPVRYACGGSAANEVIATFFRTDPPTLIAERGDSVSLMFLQRSASGARYQGRNESLWEHQGEATITWGFGAPEMRCTKAP